MDPRAALEMDKIHPNRQSSITDDEEEQDAAFTIVRVLDKVATIVDSVQASQKRIEQRHREMEDAIKTIQIDMLKLAQAHGNTGYTVNKLLEKTCKVSARVKEVRARVEKQNVNVQKVETKQEEMLRKNKFRVVIYQVNLFLKKICCYLLLQLHTFLVCLTIQRMFFLKKLSPSQNVLMLCGFPALIFLLLNVLELESTGGKAVSLLLVREVSQPANIRLSVDQQDYVLHL